MSQSLMNLVFPLSSGCCDNVKVNRLEQIEAAAKGKFAVIVGENKYYDRIQLASILFQSALSVHHKAYFIMKTPFDQPLYKIHGMTSHNFVSYSKIQIIYPKDFAQLSMYLTVLGGQPDEQLPEIIALEDLDAFLDAENTLEKLQQKSKILTLLKTLTKNNCRCVASVREDKHMKISKLHLIADEVWNFGHFKLSTYLPDQSQIHIDFTQRLDNFLLKQIRHEKLRPVPSP